MITVNWFFSLVFILIGLLLYYFICSYPLAALESVFIAEGGSVCIFIGGYSLLTRMKERTGREQS
jgi:hypothetical protein